MCSVYLILRTNHRDLLVLWVPVHVPHLCTLCKCMYMCCYCNQCMLPLQHKGLRLQLTLAPSYCLYLFPGSRHTRQAVNNSPRPTLHKVFRWSRPHNLLKVDHGPQTYSLIAMMQLHRAWPCTSKELGTLVY